MATVYWDAKEIVFIIVHTFTVTVTGEILVQLLGGFILEKLSGLPGKLNLL